MKFRFIGRYTNRHTSINACGVVFEGHEPAEVDDADAIVRLSHNPEFEAVGEADSDELYALRAEYSAKMGKKPYHGWDAATLIEKMG